MDKKTNTSTAGTTTSTQCLETETMDEKALPDCFVTPKVALSSCNALIVLAILGKSMFSHEEFECDLTSREESGLLLSTEHEETLLVLLAGDS